MKKKWLLVVGAVVVILGVLWIPQMMEKDGDKGEKQITIQLKGFEKEMVELQFDTDAKTLTDLLKSEESLKAKLENSEYGTLIIGLYGKKQDLEKGPWIVYESENNQVCVEYGMCPVSDDVILADQDVFLFELVDSFE